MLKNEKTMNTFLAVIKLPKKMYVTKLINIDSLEIIPNENNVALKYAVPRIAFTSFLKENYSIYAS